jgi:membrane protease YdiL (CAAX protease family)
MDETPLPAEIVPDPADAVPAIAPVAEPLPTPAPPHTHRWQLVGAFGLMLVLFVIGLVVGGEAEQFAWGAMQVMPFTILAVFAYLGERHLWAKVLCLLALAVIVLPVAFINIALASIALFGDAEQYAPKPPLEMAIAALKLLLVVGGTGLAALLSLIGFVPQLRQRLADYLPINPHSFVHAVALVLVVALSLVSFVPLIVLGEPPLLAFVKILQAQGVDLTEGRGTQGMLLDELYGLAWLVPATIIAVGFGIRRNVTESLERLGLVRPTWRQVVFGFGLAVPLAVAVIVTSHGVEWLWNLLGWPTTDMDTFEELLVHFISPVGALVLGVVAGLGEELAVRGVLQPRLGIWLSNLFFTALHAAQYNWDSLLFVFALGMLFGVIRQKSNTTTCAILHGTYDFVLMMGIVLEIPGFTE